MATILMPYQHLARSGNIVLAARGSSVDLFDLSTGSFLSTWTSSSITTTSPDVSSSPSAKRRKLSEAEQRDATSQPISTDDSLNADNTKQRKHNSRAEAVSSGFKSPAVICLETTSDSKHVVVVTAEDKTSRVLEKCLNEHGNLELKQISARQMPKRPCAIALTLDSNTIITADKFGDVYSLPLLSSTAVFSSVLPTLEAHKTFEPAANEFTIHSQRNLKALENQRRQAPRQDANEKPAFEGKLLLGHVSLLTHMILGRNGGKEYILTADRDEHIRISRGGEQSHIIERFCLGHQGFVTRLCIPNSDANILISGGGEDDLLTWEWLTGTLLQRTSLRPYVSDALMAHSSLDSETSEPTKPIDIVVSGIHHIKSPQVQEGTTLNNILVTVEGVPAIFVYQLCDTEGLSHTQTFPISGNVLDVLPDVTPEESRGTKRVLVSIDTVHKAGSTTLRRPRENVPVHPLVILAFENGQLTLNRDIVFEGVQAHEQVEDAKLSSNLYGLQSLRKREGEERED